MPAFWRGWLNVWGWVVIVFGLVLAGGGLDPTDGPVEILYGILGSGAAFDWTPHLRFSVALMGAVTMGWGFTILFLLPAIHAVGASAWRGLTAAMVIWFVIDGLLSAATGFALNNLPNTALAIAYLVPLLASGVLKSEA